jgi:hypothetical protein
MKSIERKISIDFAIWIASNKWYKQIRSFSAEHLWEKSGVGTKSTSELFDIFIETQKK